MKKTSFIVAACAALCIALSGCSNSSSSSNADSCKADETTTTAAAQESQSAADSSETDSSQADEQTENIDYMALVNKLNKLPDNWDEELQTEHFTNTVGDDVEVEKKAYEAYLKLKADLEADGVFVDLDSARRSVEDQQRIMDDFTKEYGKDYAIKTVAEPGYSEHHTGLALDLYLIIDGKDIVENEDMMQYPEIWEKIHSKLADYGFILRYLENREQVTGYGYEPWHIRYIDDVDKAKEITEKGLTLEEYLGKATAEDFEVDYGKSEVFTEEQLKEAAIQVKCKFATFEGCVMHNLRYDGDKHNTKDKIEIMNMLDESTEFVKVARFLCDLKTPENGSDKFEADQEIKDYEWWLGLDKDGGWSLLQWGYSPAAQENAE